VHKGLGVTATSSPGFLGRDAERDTLDRLMTQVRAGQSGVLVIRGEPGIGKTALLQYCKERAAGCRLIELAGVESEMGFPFAVLHQFCEPIWSSISALPEPQQRALNVALGSATGRPPDRFVVGVAVLGLLGRVPADEPLVCLIDDAQWLDPASAQVLGFVGRRLLAEAVGLIFAVREEADTGMFPALPELRLGGLGDQDARKLLSASVPGQLDEQVRDRLVRETGGNPLALLELPARMSPAELAGGFAVPSTSTLAGYLHDRYVERVRDLPKETQELLVLAAADPTGDAAMLWRAAQALGLDREAVVPASEERLLDIGATARFRHPLVRSAAYAAATDEVRRSAHLALAAATDAEAYPDRRAWHRAAAVVEPNEEVATELEQTAVRAQARAGLAAAAAFLERAFAITAEPERRVDRALTAALARLQAGGIGSARDLLAQAQAASVSDFQQARIERLRAQIEWAGNPGRHAPMLLLRAAARLEPLDVRLARDTYLEAWIAALVAGDLADPGGQLVDVSRAALSLGYPAEGPRACDVLLEALAMLIVEGRAAAESKLRSAVDAFLGDAVPTGEWMQWCSLAGSAACALWDASSWIALTTRHVALTRAQGALGPLAIALSAHASLVSWFGDLEAGAATVAEANAVREATGARVNSSGALLVAAYGGRPTEAFAFIEATAAEARARGEGMGVRYTSYAAAILQNALGQHRDASASAAAAARAVHDPNITPWALVELTEAAVKSGDRDQAEDGLRRLSGSMLASSDWAMGLQARSRALLAHGDEAEHWYGVAIKRLSKASLRPETARAHLLFGEWLHREHRPIDARRHLRQAHDMFTEMRAPAFSDRARRQLLAAGGKVSTNSEDTTARLTAQEHHIARLARDGHTNTEIGAELFLSARTVEWHLRKVFTKLGVTSRRGLIDVMPGRAQPSRPASP
jgi:DNA-binding CsgD family transcriptional regulator